MRIFLDANILFSASLEKSRMRALLAVLHKHAECVTNAYAVEEARRNLADLYPERAKTPITLCKQCTLIRGLAPVPEGIVPTKDTPILCGAIAGACTHLLTGDEKHFGKLWRKTIGGVRIVSPRQLAEELARGSREDSP